MSRGPLPIELGEGLAPLYAMAEALEACARAERRRRIRRRLMVLLLVVLYCVACGVLWGRAGYYVALLSVSLTAAIVAILRALDNAPPELR